MLRCEFAYEVQGERCPDSFKYQISSVLNSILYGPIEPIQSTKQAKKGSGLTIDKFPGKI
jgi:hypothetical protein